MCALKSWSGIGVEPFDNPPAICINAMSSMPAHPPTKNVATSHQIETMWFLLFLRFRTVEIIASRLRPAILRKTRLDRSYLSLTICFLDRKKKSGFARTCLRFRTNLNQCLFHYRPQSRESSPPVWDSIVASLRALLVLTTRVRSPDIRFAPVSLCREALFRFTSLNPRIVRHPSDTR